MTVKIKKIEYLVAPKDLLNDAVDVLVDLEDDSDEFGYVVEVTTPQFLSTIMEKENNKLNLELTKNEALVLFDFLNRINETERKGLFEDQSEERILWDLEALLEKQLSELFRTDYKEIIEKAREQVRDEIE